MTKSHKLVSKRYKTKNLVDKKLQTSEKRYKTVNVGDTKLQH